MFTDEEWRNCEATECSRLNELRQAGDLLCKVFAKANDDEERCRLLLEFASRQDNALDAEPQEDEMPCVAEESAPPLFRVCCEELAQAGLLRMRRKETFYRYPDMGKIGVAIFILGLTYKGRLELARLNREANQRSWHHKLKWFLTLILGAVIPEFVRKLFK